MLTVFAGPSERADALVRDLEAHADWLDCRAHVLRHPLSPGTTLLLAAWCRRDRPAHGLPMSDGQFAWASGAPHDPLERLDPARARAQWVAGLAGGRGRHVRVLANLVGGQVRVWAPLASPVQVLFAASGNGWIVSDDPRLFARRAGAALDDRALYALLQHSHVPAPIGLWRGTERVPPGHVLHLAAGSVPYAEPWFAAAEREPSAGDPVDSVAEALDRQLARIPAGSVLHFSGGVDSALLAARFRAPERSDLQLVSFTFGPGDPAGELSGEMARALGRPVHTVTFKYDKLGDVLGSLARTFTYPFSDTATPAAKLLLAESAPYVEPGAVIVEGVGADALFGQWPHLHDNDRIEAMPAIVRHAAASTYRAGRLWTREGTLAERADRMRRSVQLPPIAALLTARHSLLGVAFHAPRADRTVVDAAVAASADPFAGPLSDEQRFSLFEAINLVAQTAAAKTFDPAAHLGIAVVNPYLEPDLIAATLSLCWDERFKRGEPKGLLKELLASAVPRELVYRRKLSFDPPWPKLFAHESFQAALRDQVLDPAGPLASLLIHRNVRAMADRAARRDHLPVGAYFFLWGAIMTALWLHELPASGSGGW